MGLSPVDVLNPAKTAPDDFPIKAMEGDRCAYFVVLQSKYRILRCAQSEVTLTLALLTLDARIGIVRRFREYPDHAATGASVEVWRAEKSPALP